MPRSSRPGRLAVLLFVALLGAGAGCSFDLRKDPPSHFASAARDQEEVLDEDDQSFSSSERGPQGVAGEILVVFGYVGMIVASAVLPLFLLL